MEFIDYYKILNVPSSATLEDIRKSYRRLALQHHPDLTKNPDSAEFMRLLNEAYSLLSNPRKRAQYDFLQKNGFQSYTSSRKTRSRSYSSIYSITVAQQYQNQSLDRMLTGETYSTFRQVLYQLLYSFFSSTIYLFLVMIPAIPLFIIFGYFYSWIAPYIGISSDDALALTLITTTIVTFVTVLKLWKRMMLSILSRNMGYL